MRRLLAGMKAENRNINKRKERGGRTVAPHKAEAVEPRGLPKPGYRGEVDGGGQVGGKHERVAP